MSVKHASGSLTSLLKAVLKRLVKLGFGSSHIIMTKVELVEIVCLNLSKYHSLYPGLKEFPQRSKECELPTEKQITQPSESDRLSFQNCYSSYETERKTKRSTIPRYDLTERLCFVKLLSSGVVTRLENQNS